MIYELMIVANTKSGDSVLGRVEKALKDLGASSLSNDNMGRKTLAYPIAKQTEAQYSVFSFDVAPDAISKINGMLKFEEEAILRYLLVTKAKPSRKVRKVQEVREVQKVEEEPVKAKVTVVTKGTKGVKVTEGTKVAKVLKEKKEVKAKK